MKQLMLHWKQSVIGREPFEKRIRLVDNKGVYKWHMLKAVLFLDQEGQLTNWFGSCTNIDDYVQDMKRKDEFINIASHELKTPITSLKALLQLLERMKGDLSNKMIPGLIEKANRNVNKVNDLVADLLNVSAMNDGQLQLNKTAINLAELIGDCVHHIRIDQQYEIITEGDTNIMVMADAGRIEQVITNFITNAIKYAPDSKKIMVVLSQTIDDVKVAVTDKGPGILPEKIPHLFDRYYQVNDKSNHYSGLGLGLYICAEIIKKHNGKIGAISDPGNGSTFWFSIPI
ncbi:HAMP domain-containing sensor histidine kinase [Mucilaginibacter sp. CAU 1740]|uniref:sensor histidine kinase n=1 Tax=Mucilaginibacter sp. CAU 1740 TaxID=3140365 RepID=UPI00325AC029